MYYILDIDCPQYNHEDVFKYFDLTYTTIVVLDTVINKKYYIDINNDVDCDSDFLKKCKQYFDFDYIYGVLKEGLMILNKGKIAILESLDDLCYINTSVKPEKQLVYYTSYCNIFKEGLVFHLNNDYISICNILLHFPDNWFWHYGCIYVRDCSCSVHTGFKVLCSREQFNRLLIKARVLK